VTDLLRRFTLASWLIALLFVINPIVDAATNAWPFYPASVEWRFASTGILSNYFVSILFGLLMMGAIAVAKQQRTVLRLVGGVSGLLALFLLVASVSYGFDTLQLRPVVREEQLPMFRIGAVKTAFKIGGAVLGTVLLALGAFKAARDAGA
jgi:hypothetical protein